MHNKTLDLKPQQPHYCGLLTSVKLSRQFIFANLNKRPPNLTRNPTVKFDFEIKGLLNPKFRTYSFQLKKKI